MHKETFLEAPSQALLHRVPWTVPRRQSSTEQEELNGLDDFRASRHLARSLAKELARRLAGVLRRRNSSYKMPIQ